MTSDVEKLIRALESELDQAKRDAVAMLNNWVAGEHDADVERRVRAYEIELRRASATHG